MNNKEWASLFDQFNPKKLDFESNKHLFIKVAFGCFQLNSSPTRDLWVLEEGEDGKQYLAAAYDSDETIETTGTWNALANKEASMVVLYYKDFPIYKFSAKEYGFNEENAQVFQKVLVKKAGDDNFIKVLMDSQTKEKRAIILEQFPELNK